MDGNRICDCLLSFGLPNNFDEDPIGAPPLEGVLEDFEFFALDAGGMGR